MNANHLKIVEINIDCLIPFHNTPYPFNEDTSFSLLVDSIKRIGLIEPILLIPAEKEDEYEIVSGLRRVEACRRLGYTTIPSIVLGISYDEATVLHCDSNLTQRHRS